MLEVPARMGTPSRCWPASEPHGHCVCISHAQEGKRPGVTAALRIRNQSGGRGLHDFAFPDNSQLPEILNINMVRAYYVPCTLVSNLNILTHLRPNNSVNYYYYLHFIDKNRGTEELGYLPKGTQRRR